MKTVIKTQEKSLDSSKTFRENCKDFKSSIESSLTPPSPVLKMKLLIVITLLIETAKS